MEIIETVFDMKELVTDWKNSGSSMGLVPTMGFLHEGHISLIKTSLKENHKTIVSIFVNPIQFSDNEDLDDYPRDSDSDIRICNDQEVDAVFIPSVSEMYPVGFSSVIDESIVSQNLIGELRPGHFKGVCTVVCKLFNITGADRAYFGKKDAQQLAVIRKMVKDLNMNVNVIECPTVRDEEGLAMSSRNSYLSAEEHSRATSVYQALRIGKDTYISGEVRSHILKSKIEEYLDNEPDVTVNYIEIVDPDTMQPRETIKNGDDCLISVQVGTTTLIDNIGMEKD